MEIDEKKLKSAYDKACGNTKCVLEALFPSLRGEVTERIKTFDDAVRELGESHPSVVAYRSVENIGCMPDDIMAYLKLRVITAALNEGWEPKFSNDEWRYFPWFYFIGNDELRKKSEKWKSENVVRGCENHRVAFGGSASYGASAGFVSAYALGDASNATADYGSRLCFKTSALAEYACKQFIDIWMDFILIRK